MTTLAKLAALVVFGAIGHSGPAQGSAAVASPFLGRWDVTLHGPARDFGEWLEVTQQNGAYQARMVGRWGHAHDVLGLQVESDTLRFESPMRQEGLPNNLVYRGVLSGGKITGSVEGFPSPGWTWTAVPAPPLDDPGQMRWGKPIELFNGHDLSGWRFTKPEDGANWSASEGVLRTARKGSDLVSQGTFTDFKLHVEFNCEARCNSGVYLRGRYEVQIADAPATLSATQRAGAIYGFIAPASDVTVVPGTWETYDIVLTGRFVSISYNGVKVVDHQEIPGITGGALDSDEAAPGPICLQGSEKAGGTSFRNIVLTPALPSHARARH